MPKLLIDNKSKIISVPVPLTANSGKIRIKNRSIVNEYGITFATKINPFKQSNYVEWMIGYDVIKSDKAKLSESTLKTTEFIGANKKAKSLFELSEIIYYFYNWGIITPGQIENLKSYITSIKTINLIDNNDELQISRDNFRNKRVNGIDFKYTQVKYPLLVKEFGLFEVIAEIKITEQQRAMNTQPMLYICFPITELKSNKQLLGRCAKTKEFAKFEITKNNINVFIETFRLFGTLSQNHKHDILEIIEIIKNS
jgi:hypothetical protein